MGASMGCMVPLISMHLEELNIWCHCWPQLLLFSFHKSLSGLLGLRWLVRGKTMRRQSSRARRMLWFRKGLVYQGCLLVVKSPRHPTATWSPNVRLFAQRTQVRKKEAPHLHILSWIWKRPEELDVLSYYVINIHFKKQ